ncbi:hypothetical protein ID0507_03010 [Helicobacter pylori]|uniref:tetratricopeptide repeat protein n=1 Tax=Helicobacter pylori TaxID=210 RepID=UPI002159D4CE|nr:tetratricopeptide repeat protein [Helicobacter pylori]
MDVGFLGDFYENGKYVKKDLRKAAQYYSKACGLNDQDGCLILGYKQYAGKGVVKNEKQAVKTFEKACRLGSEDACGILNNY